MRGNLGRARDAGAVQEEGVRARYSEYQAVRYCNPSTLLAVSVWALYIMDLMSV